VLVEAHRRPVVPYGAGPEAASLGATAMCDVSDGLLADLGHIASASGVAIDLDSAAFDVPEAIRDAAAALGARPLDWIVTGGEDYAFATTFHADVALPHAWRIVGTVTAGEGVTIDGSPFAGDPGHVHFSG
jgi:thiamine-monophosphate kinase